MKKKKREEAKSIPDTPREVVEQLLDIDPKLGGNESSKEHILNRIDMIHGGVPTFDTLRKLITNMDIQNKDNAVKRIVGGYRDAVVNKLGEDSLLGSGRRLEEVS